MTLRGERSIKTALKKLRIFFQIRLINDETQEWIMESDNLRSNFQTITINHHCDKILKSKFRPEPRKFPE